MKGEKEGARPPDSARISRPHPSLPHGSLNCGTWRVPRSMAWRVGAKERKGRKDRNRESEFCFVLKISHFFSQNIRAASSTSSHPTSTPTPTPAPASEGSVKNLLSAYKGASKELRGELRILQARGPRSGRTWPPQCRPCAGRAASFSTLRPGKLSGPSFEPGAGGRA